MHLLINQHYFLTKFAYNTASYTLFYTINGPHPANHFCHHLHFSLKIQILLSSFLHELQSSSVGDHM